MTCCFHVLCKHALSSLQSPQTLVYSVFCGQRIDRGVRPCYHLKIAPNVQISVNAIFACRRSSNARNPKRPTVAARCPGRCAVLVKRRVAQTCSRDGSICRALFVRSRSAFSLDTLSKHTCSHRVRILFSCLHDNDAAAEEAAGLDQLTALQPMVRSRKSKCKAAKNRPSVWVSIALTIAYNEHTGERVAVERPTLRRVEDSDDKAKS